MSPPFLSHAVFQVLFKVVFLVIKRILDLPSILPFCQNASPFSSMLGDIVTRHTLNSEVWKQLQPNEHQIIFGGKAAALEVFVQINYITESSFLGAKTQGPAETQEGGCSNYRVQAAGGEPCRVIRSSGENSAGFLKPEKDAEPKCFCL